MVWPLMVTVWCEDLACSIRGAVAMSASVILCSPAVAPRKVLRSTTGPGAPGSSGRAAGAAAGRSLGPAAWASAAVAVAVRLSAASAATVLRIMQVTPWRRMSMARQVPRVAACEGTPHADGAQPCAAVFPSHFVTVLFGVCRVTRGGRKRDEIDLGEPGDDFRRLGEGQLAIVREVLDAHGAVRQGAEQPVGQLRMHRPEREQLMGDELAVGLRRDAGDIRDQGPGADVAGRVAGEGVERPGVVGAAAG